MPDVRIVNETNGNQGTPIAAQVRALPRANAILFAQVNVSGDIVNPGGSGGAGSNVNVNQVAGTNTSVNAGNADNGTQRVVLASDQGTIPVSGTFNVISSPPPVTGVQVVGGISSRVSISGDQLAVIQQGAWAVAGTGDFSTIPKANSTWPISTPPIGVNVIGGSVGGRFSASGDFTVREQAVTGVQIVGGVSSRVSISGDQLSVVQQGAWASSITGDVLLRANPNVIIGQIGNTVGVNIIGGSAAAQVAPSGGTIWTVSQNVPIGVQVLGGQVGGSHGVSGDVSIKANNTTPAGIYLPVSGDFSVADGTNKTIKATVKQYTDSNPVAVVLMNPSGDAYLPVPKEPICTTIPFRITSGGTTTIAGPYTGRVIKVCSYDFQGESDSAGTTQCRFGSAASGTQLTPDWNLNPREGVVKAVSPLGGGYIFKTLLNQALVVENSGSNVRGSVTFHTGDAF